MNINIFIYLVLFDPIFLRYFFLNVKNILVFVVVVVVVLAYKLIIIILFSLNNLDIIDIIVYTNRIIDYNPNI